MENQNVTMSLTYYTALVERACKAEAELEDFKRLYYSLYAENKTLKERLEMQTAEAQEATA